MRLSEYPDYIFNSDGTIYSTLSNKILKYSVNSNGYSTCRLKNIRGLFVTKSVHRLIAQAFYPTINYVNLHVDHLNAKKTDNDIFNLQFVTHTENMLRASQLGLFKPNNPLGEESPSSKQVVLKCLENNNIYSFGTVGEAMSYLGYKNISGSWNRAIKGDRILRGHFIVKVICK